MSFQLSFYKNDVVGAESNPNSVAPAANRIIRVPRDRSDGYAALLWVGDGTSLGVTLWFKDANSTLWVPVAPTLTVAKDDPNFVIVPSDVDIFAQLGANTGAVTKFGLGFLSPEALNEMQFDVNGNLKVAVIAGGSSVVQGGVVGSTTQKTVSATSLDANHNGLDGAIYGTYKVTPPTLFDGQIALLQTDSRGNLKVAEQYQAQAFDDAAGVVFNSDRALPLATGAWSFTSSNGTKVGTAGINLKASGGRLRYLAVMNNAATKYYVMINNKASAPVNGDAPIHRKVLANAADSFVDFDFGPHGLWLPTGVSFALSSTVDTLTLAVANDMHYLALWI